MAHGSTGEFPLKAVRVVVSGRVGEEYTSTVRREEGPGETAHPRRLVGPDSRWAKERRRGVSIGDSTKTLRDPLDFRSLGGRPGRPRNWGSERTWTTYSLSSARVLVGPTTNKRNSYFDTHSTRPGSCHCKVLIFYNKILE